VGTGKPGRRTFEAAQAWAIEEIVRGEFDGFRGMEAPGSRADRQVRRRIRRCSGSMLRACLADRLREHQLRNNRHVTARRRP